MDVMTLFISEMPSQLANEQSLLSGLCLWIVLYIGGVPIMGGINFGEGLDDGVAICGDITLWEGDFEACLIITSSLLASYSSNRAIRNLAVLNSIKS